MDKKIKKKIEKYKNFSKLIYFIFKKNIFQKKSITKTILLNDKYFLDQAESIVKRIFLVSKKIKKKITIEQIAEIYLWYTDLLKKEELYFEKYRNYRNKSYKKVFKEVYNRPDYMFKYAIGLGISQIFWENHIKVFDFFKKNFSTKAKSNSLMAEIGMGHGLFTSQVFRDGGSNIKSIMIDVSDMCLKFAKNMAIRSGAKEKDILQKKIDIQKNIPLKDNSLDLLLLGEVIEHLGEGRKVMESLTKKMKKNGICYFSTPANGPAEDHILLFTKVAQIRKFIKRCSWKIIKESCITLGNMSVEFAEKKRKVINYCAILKRT